MKPTVEPLGALTQPRSPPLTPSPSSTPLVSVCIVNWNCRALLRNCLRSLAPQRQGVPLEVIVVDNASTDGAADMVARDFPGVVLLRNDSNAGFARANNQAARLARGAYLFFLNNDTVVPDGALARLCRFAAANPRAGLVGPCLRDGQGRVQTSARRRPSLAALTHRLTWLRWTGLFRSAYRAYRGRNGNPRDARRVEVLMGAALLMPRAVYQRVGGWDESYTFGGEDIDLCARVGRSFDVLHHPAVEITHFGRASSRQRPGWASAQTLIGITHSLRQAGTNSWALAAYKLALMIDLPLRGLLLTMRFGWSKLRGRRTHAGRAWQDLCGLGWFVRHGLGAFWRA
jgi:GT2 family glycosyltransferase